MLADGHGPRSYSAVMLDCTLGFWKKMFQGDHGDGIIVCERRESA